MVNNGRVAYAKGSLCLLSWLLWRSTRAPRISGDLLVFRLTTAAHMEQYFSCERADTLGGKRLEPKVGIDILGPAS
ncbi:uncharacterized protein BDR25DRAFT_39193 [Lindgomyces ingoldianus]|uniref:Uncharacterized protein n=1 Tax=Lindgomyces ingoldianus TaxID=673940 RepID=A0ACB6QSE2_9PLEO|nr:uncharacterized protein BDR25DRAFT_39193 [Lindgomyces ingoldianus]KAF2469757.1 hypothetical protein BDR25DRAFT_39193 [Lindgomyces ingoldianus]